MNQWEHFSQRANEFERYNYKTLGENVADPDGSVRKRRREIDDAQLQVAAELKNLREQFEASQKAQSKENQINRLIAVATLIVTVISMIAAIIALIL